jgi:Flp pilus assembly protein TadB
MSRTALLGGGIGAGVVLVLLALRPRHQALVSALRDLDRSPSAPGHGRAEFVARRLAIALEFGHIRTADLHIVGRTFEHHALRKMAAAASLGALAPACVVLARLGGVDVAASAAAVPAVALAAVGYVVPDVELRSLAAERRAAFVHALSSYLDVTAVLLAGGAGTETALNAAAALGSGWPQRQLRSALDRCRLTGQTPWEAFGELGDRLDVTELSQLSTSLQLAGEHGARVRLTLTERARALRAQQLADVEARARAVTEQMSVPVALLAVAFMLFVGFPAVWVVLGEL